MREPTQKEMATFYGVSENTIVNWKKAKTEKDPKTGRQNIFNACRFYLKIREESELYKEVLEQIHDSIEMLDSEKKFVIEGEKVNLKDLAKKNLRDSKTKLKELSEILSYAI